MWQSMTFANKSTMTTNLDATRCKACGLIQPCPCDVAKGIHDLEPEDKGVDRQVIIVSNKKKSGGGVSDHGAGEGWGGDSQ